MKLTPEKFALNDYLGAEFTCACGRTHKTKLREIAISSGALGRVPSLMAKMGHKSPLLVCDKNTYAAAGEKLASVLEEAGVPYGIHILSQEDVVPDEATLGELLMACTPSVDLLLAVGTGTINDLCKYLSWQLGIQSFSIATAPSMDGFASTGAALITDNLKTTYETHSPEVIVGDLDVLCAAPMEMIAAGLGDILGKYTCLLDWKVANLVNGEYYCPTIVEMVKIALEKVAENSSRISQRSPAVIGDIMEALVLTGIAMSFVGNSRPASGSEHHISHFWEMQFLFQGKKAVLHGRKVGVGTVTVLRLYQQLAKTQPDFAKARGRLDTLDDAAWEANIRRTLGKAAQKVIELEARAEKNGRAGCEKRLTVIQEHWGELVELIKTSLPACEDVSGVLQSLDSPINPLQLGIDRETIIDSVTVAKEVRDRYTLLQLLWDLGLLDSFAAWVADYFVKENDR